MLRDFNCFPFLSFVYFVSLKNLPVQVHLTPSFHSLLFLSFETFSSFSIISISQSQIRYLHISMCQFFIYRPLFTLFFLQNFPSYLPSFVYFFSLIQFLLSSSLLPSYSTNYFISSSSSCYFIHSMPFFFLLLILPFKLLLFFNFYFKFHIPTRFFPLHLIRIWNRNCQRNRVFLFDKGNIKKNEISIYIITIPFYGGRERNSPSYRERKKSSFNSKSMMMNMRSNYNRFRNPYAYL